MEDEDGDRAWHLDMYMAMNDLEVGNVDGNAARSRAPEGPLDF